MLRNAISVAVELLVHKLHTSFHIKPNSHDSLNRRNERMVRDFAQSYSVQRLAKKYNLTDNRISQVLTAFGVRQPKWKKMSDETRLTIFKLQKKGLSKAEIGRKVGVSRERVRQILHQDCLFR
jgi:hypothetical protein